jgi:hypothetical protein
MPRRAGAVRRAGRNRVGHGGRSSHGQAAGAGGTGTESFTNLANDKTFTNVFTQVNKDLKVTDNGDGTLTILGMGAGMSKYLGPDGFLFLDAGQFRFDNATTPKVATSATTSTSSSANNAVRPGGPPPALPSTSSAE